MTTTTIIGIGAIIRATGTTGTTGTTIMTTIILATVITGITIVRITTGAIGTETGAPR
jgi:hypothetical protein